VSRGARTALAALAVLLPLALLTGCGGSDPPVVGPSVTVPGPGERETLFGTTVYRGDASFADALARQDAAYGRLQVARIFYPGDPPLWPGSPAGEADRPVVVSFKLPPAEVIAGVHDEALRAWFASIPTDRPVWWSYFHEPENDAEDGSFTAEQFRQAFRHVSELASKTPNPALHGAVILQCRTATGEAGRSVADFDPGSDTYDVLAFDCYNRQQGDGVYPDPATWLAPVVAAAQQVGRPWALAELGSQLVDGDDGTARATWLGEVAAFAIAAKAPFVTYFDSGITGIDYRLTDTPSRSAWHQIVSGP
jgi:hypothetical protein